MMGMSALLSLLLMIYMLPVGFITILLTRLRSLRWLLMMLWLYRSRGLRTLRLLGRLLLVVTRDPFVSLSVLLRSPTLESEMSRLVGSALMLLIAR